MVSVALKGRAMNAYLLVFLGGGIGSMLRLGTYRLARVWLSPDFPWGTLAVNVVGGFAAGLVTGLLAGRTTAGADATALFLMTGVLGGFTTFSAFGVDAVLLFQKGAYGSGLTFVLGSVALALAGVLIGMWTVRPA
jgi:CrcB protein